MLTPNEINGKKFDKVMVWGYDMNAVDSFLESVSADYTQLYKENIALKNKMKVLVSKIEEYRSVDESMRQALLNAKNLAAEMSENAENEAGSIRAAAQAEAEQLRSAVQAETAKLRAETQAEAAKLREEAQAYAEKCRTDAEAEAQVKLASYKERIAAEEMRLEEAKTNVQVFIDKSIALYKNELEALTTMREQELSYEITVPVKIEEPVPAPIPVTVEISAPVEPVTEPVAEVSAVVEDNEVSEMPAAIETEEEEEELPDTIVLPNLPPIPTVKPAATPQTASARKNVYEVDTDDSSDEDEFARPAKRRIDEVVAAKRAAAKRAAREEDGEETIILTPKPRFEFSNLQFGDKYSTSDKKRK